MVVLLQRYVTIAIIALWQSTLTSFTCLSRRELLLPRVHSASVYNYESFILFIGTVGCFGADAASSKNHTTRLGFSRE